MKLEICIHCYHYQHRLNWMLNSILQQKGEIPDIEVSISYMPNDGIPTTEKIIEFFREKGLKILDILLTKEQVANRAVARNIRLKDTQADWILFADGDLVYAQDFFANLKKKLESDTFKNETRAIGADRSSLKDDFCIKYFEEDKREYPCIIDNVESIAKEFPNKHTRGGPICAGYFQLANVKSVRERNIVYCGRSRDHLRNTKGDREFRIRMGGRVGVNEVTDKENGSMLRQYHLNHDRSGPEIQR